MRRRHFLATLGAGTLAGCGALGGSNFKSAEDPFTQVESTEEGGANVQSGLAVLGKNEYASASFQGGGNTGSFEVEVTGQVMQGGRIDVFIMTLQQFNEYQRQPNIVTSVAEATSTQSPQFRQELEAGQYLLVFDNTSLSSAQPSGEARIQFRIAVSRTGTATGTATGTQ